MNKKIKKTIIISISVAAIVATIATPLISMTTKNEQSNTEVSPIITQRNEDRASEAIRYANENQSPDINPVDAAAALYNPNNPGSFFDTSAGRNFAAEARMNNVKDPNVWYSDYTPIDWANTFDYEFEWDYAYKYGWTIDKYQQFIMKTYEMKGPDFNEFGKNVTVVGNWIANHMMPNHPEDASAYMSNAGEDYDKFYTGISSPANPLFWDDAWQVESNHIDNTLTWYAYDRNNTFFIFDENNIENGWNRLVNFGRLVPTNASSIESDDAIMGDNGTPDDKSDDVATGLRNYVMLDGELVDILTLPSGDYYYVKDAGDEFVRDDNGWRVVISKPTDWTDPEILTKTINPKNSLDTANAKTYADNIQHHPYDPADEVSIAYPTDYIMQPTYRPKMIDTTNTSQVTNKHTDGGVVGQNYYNTLRGKYQILAKADSFSNLVLRDDVVFPNEHLGGGWISTNMSRRHDVPQRSNYPGDQMMDRGDRFGYGTTQYNILAAEVGYDWVWVEDGQGGHKVAKNLQPIVNETKFKLGLPVDTPNDEVIFYGNSNHVWGDADQFHKSTFSKTK